MCHKFRGLVLMLVLLLVTTSLAGCNAGAAGHDEGQNEKHGENHVAMMAEVSAMPSQVQRAEPMIRDAYRFAATHADELQQIPCYCGCGPMGHGSNYACFWQEDGNVDQHALNCGICVYIAHDVRQGLARGQSLAEIRAQVDADYSRYGPPTDTAPVAISTQ